MGQSLLRVQSVFHLARTQIHLRTHPVFHSKVSEGMVSLSRTDGKKRFGLVERMKLGLISPEVLLLQ